MRLSRQLLPAVVIGAIAGLRTFTAPAAISRAARNGLIEVRGPVLKLLDSERASNILTAMAVLEIVADKMPWIPARTKPLPLGARILSGAFSGAALSPAAARRQAAAAGAIAAIVFAFAGARFRRLYAEESEIPDLLVALAEDATAVGAAVSLLCSRAAVT